MNKFLNNQTIIFY